jgi:tRNA pseudouridine38-40 synthase
MPLYRLTLAYDGTDFEGWQLQIRAAPRPPRTVQGTLEGALKTFLGGTSIRVAGAGRTDAGVHAEGQVASFPLPREIPPETLVRALNGILPRDVRAVHCDVATPDFHARRSAVSKLYRYVLDTGPIQLPTRRRFAGHVPFRLDETFVHEAARVVVGKRDFRSLAAAGGSVKTTVRTLFRSEARFTGETLVYEAEADGFLRRMVLNLVGGLIACGRGVLRPRDLLLALDARDRRAWPKPAEPRGLTLVRVSYGDSVLP